VLAVSRWDADAMLALAHDLEVKLPGTKAAFLDGILGQDKAAIIARAVAVLDPAEARAAEALVLGRAGRLTPAGLRSAIACAVIDGSKIRTLGPNSGFAPFAASAGRAPANSPAVKPQRFKSVSACLSDISPNLRRHYCSKGLSLPEILTPLIPEILACLRTSRRADLQRKWSTIRTSGKLLRRRARIGRCGLWPIPPRHRV